MELNIAGFIATTADSLRACQNRPGNNDWAERWYQILRYLESEHLPSGSGFDNGCRIIDEQTCGSNIRIMTEYHVMVDGMYIGWLHLIVDFSATFNGIDWRIVEVDSTDVREYDDIEYLVDVIIDDIHECLIKPYSMEDRRNTIKLYSELF